MSRPAAFKSGKLVSGKCEDNSWCVSKPLGIIGLLGTTELATEVTADMDALLEDTASTRFGNIPAATALPKPVMALIPPRVVTHWLTAIPRAISPVKPLDTEG